MHVLQAFTLEIWAWFRKFCFWWRLLAHADTKNGSQIGENHARIGAQMLGSSNKTIDHRIWQSNFPWPVDTHRAHVLQNLPAESQQKCNPKAVRVSMCVYLFISNIHSRSMFCNHTFSLRNTEERKSLHLNNCTKSVYSRTRKHKVTLHYKKGVCVASVARDGKGFRSDPLCSVTKCYCGSVILTSVTLTLISLAWGVQCSAEGKSEEEECGEVASERSWEPRVGVWEWVSVGEKRKGERL